MTESKDPTWLETYYNKLQADTQTSLQRRDNVTNWSYTIVIAILTIYFGFFTNNFGVHQFWRYMFVIGTLVVLIRFFFQSMISYAFFLRYRHLKTIIEKHWMRGSPSIEEVIKEIEKYEHGREMPPTKRNRLWDGQIRSGFIIVLVIPLFLIANEFHMLHVVPVKYYEVLIGLGIYVVLEIINFKLYDQMKKSKQ